VGLSGNLSPDKPTLHIGDYFFGMYAPLDTLDNVPAQDHVIPPVVASVAGINWMLDPSTGLPTFRMAVTSITPAPVIVIPPPAREAKAVEIPTPNDVFIAVILPQAGKYPFSLRKATKPLDMLLIALVTSDNFALSVWAWYIGTAMAAKIPMMAMTINNSINVKPFCPLFRNITQTSFFNLNAL
jgi:hypothetical protein